MSVMHIAPYTFDEVVEFMMEHGFKMVHLTIPTMESKTKPNSFRDFMRYMQLLNYRNFRKRYAHLVDELGPPQKPLVTRFKGRKINAHQAYKHMQCMLYNICDNYGDNKHVKRFKEFRDEFLQWAFTEQDEYKEARWG